MVLILDGNSEHGAHMKENISYGIKKNQICDCFGSNALNRSNNMIPHTCAPISKLPSNLSTMIDHINSSLDIREFFVLHTSYNFTCLELDMRNTWMEIGSVRI